MERSWREGHPCVDLICLIHQMIAEQTVVAKVRRVTYVGMAVNIAIAVLKGGAGLAFSSRALFADAVHSLSDLMTDIAVILGVRYWTAPADSEHPYGHGKIEALVELFIALALVAVAYGLGAQAVQAFAAGKQAVGHCLVEAALRFAVLPVECSQQGLKTAVGFCPGFS